MRFRKGAATALVLAAGLFGVAACGDDDDNESGAGAAAPAATTDAAAGSDSGAGQVDESKPPVVLALNSLKIPLVDLLTPYEAGAAAAAKKINAEGGFGGRKVVIESCNTQYQPATTAACARKALDKDPMAMIGCDPTWPNAGLPIFERAKVPSFNCINTEQDYTNPYNFGMTGGQDGDQRAAARWLCTKADVKKVLVFTQDIPFQRANAPKVIGTPLKECGKSASYVFYPTTGADLTPFVGKAARSKPDFVITLGGGPLAVQIFKQFQQSGISADRIIGSANAFAYEQVLKPAGDAMEGAIGTIETKSWGQTDDPGIAEYLKAMEGEDYDAQDTNPLTAYMSVMTVYTAAKEIGFDKFDTASLKEFMDSANNVQVPTTRDILNPGPEGYPQIKQPYVQIVQWKDGKLSPVLEGTEDGWVKAF
jgi:ABC-type branched-subunit amino acid transport system substrate-binding protein